MLFEWDYRIIHKDSFYWVQYGKFGIWFTAKRPPGPSCADAPIPFNDCHEAESYIEHKKEIREKHKKQKSPKKIIGYY